MGIREIHNRLIKGETTSVALTKEHLNKAKTSKLNTFITVCEERALVQAEAADKRIKEGNALPLTGIPLGVKDLLTVRGVKTTCGSKILENYIAPYSATVVEKLETAGAVILGKLNMDEFAMGSSNEHSAFGPVKNPIDETRIPGGSSGGSAAAAAAGECIATLGTDTGGSIRQPAAMCGVVGLKPTYGRVSRYGLTAFASSLDQIGPLAANVEDAAIMLETISGHDPKDATSVNRPVPDYTVALKKDVKGLKIGVPKEYFIKGLSEEIGSSVKSAIEELKKMGAEVKEISLPHTDHALACYYIIAPAECSANLARFDGVRYGRRAKDVKDIKELYERSRAEGFGPEVTLRIMVGTYVLSSGYYDAYYRKAQCARTLITKDFTEAFQRVDVIMTPTTPTTAFKLGEKTDDPLQMYLSDIFTIPVNLAGLPAMSMPCGKDKLGLPIGMQIIGRHFDEETILRVGYNYEAGGGRQEAR
ncbi:MAG: Asp-tRNA(Asn)/Glu-tRNA(Gln) amidotransferase GatCAB subunit A [Deltaproteobacteria bacterium CG11_big_fil_rev_8_21_14_0_20_49_13]|nr:MAG: Asp-tRNA(Asn)/Glu-tRNA(Gln) amidotransferase GatCAB subunit A [Deltaproteobacteria bacterium CG11_big_fil_rev_8_21_14_0_20_49_13]